MNHRAAFAVCARALGLCAVLSLPAPSPHLSGAADAVRSAPSWPTQSPAPSWANYTTGDDVVALARDASSGGVVAATTGGAVFWGADGAHLKATAGDGLCANRLTDVALTGDGEAWLGSVDGGICGLDARGMWQYLNPTTGSVLDRETAVWAVAADSSDVWASAGRGVLLRLDGDEWRRLELPAPLAEADVDDLAVAPDGSLWVVASSVSPVAARRSPDGQWQAWTQADGLPVAGQERRLAVDASGDVWMGALHYGGAARFGPDGRWHAVDWYEGGPIAADPAGGVWTATVTWLDDVGDFADDLVVRHALAETTPATYVWANTFENSQATAVVADGAGGAWIGTDGQGMVHLADDGTWSRRRTGDPVPDNWPVAVAFGPDGAAWIAHNSALFTGVVRRDSTGTWSWLPMPDALAWIAPTPPGNAATLRSLADIAVDAAGTVWTAGQGVLRLAPSGEWSPVGEPDAPAESFTVAAAPDGSVWYGTAGGVVIHDAGGGWRRLGTGIRQLEDEVSTIAFDADGRAWLCTPDGVGRHSDAGWEYLAVPEAQADLGVQLVGGLAVDERGRPWVATTDGRVGYFTAEGALELEGDAGGLELATVWSPRLVADPRGDGIWTSAVRLPAHDDGSRLAYDGGLLHRRSSGLWEAISPWDGLGGMEVVDLTVDRESGDILAAVAGGVARLATTTLPGDESSRLYLPFAHETRPVEPPDELDADEYAVYRVAIEHMFGDVGYERYVIRDRTWPYDLDLAYVSAQIPDLARATHDAYTRRNKEPHPLADAFGLAVPVKLIAREELDEIFGSPDGWDEFYRRYPGSLGEMTLSRVGFDQDRGQALLYLGNQSHWLAGAGWAILLERSAYGWTVIRWAFLWIS